MARKKVEPIPNVSLIDFANAMYDRPATIMEVVEIETIFGRVMASGPHNRLAVQEDYNLTKVYTSWTHHELCEILKDWPAKLREMIRAKQRIRSKKSLIPSTAAAIEYLSKRRGYPLNGRRHARSLALKWLNQAKTRGCEWSPSNELFSTLMNAPHLGHLYP